MFEIRPYEGTAEELSEFVVGTWSGDYAGKLAVPLSSPDYFRWQLRLGDPAARHHQLAAYDRDRLVGVLLGRPSTFRTPAGVVTGQHGSWLSIAPDCRGKGMVGQLTRERVRQQTEHGAGLVAGYRFFGSRHSLAERPDPKKQDPTRSFHARLGFWARVLDAPRVAAWNVLLPEAALARLGGPFIPNPRIRQTRDLRIRPLSAGDIPGCVELLDRKSKGLPLAVAWTDDDLRQHLAGSPLSQTFVADSGGTIRGLVNYHILPFLGRTEAPVGVIDIIAVDELTWFEGDQLLQTALVQMQGDGAVVALKLRCGDAPWGTMLRTHFVPRLPDSYLVLQWIGTPQTIPRRSGLHLLWR